MEYAVILYPPVGTPRVIELPDTPPEVKNLMGKKVQLMKTREEAEAKLEKFLNENPEYRRWRDGAIQPESDYTPDGQEKVF